MNNKTSGGGGGGGEGGGAVRLRPIQRAGGRCCSPSADSTSGVGLSAFGRFNERVGGGGGGEVLFAFGRFNERRGGGGAVRFRPIQRAGGGGRGGAVRFRPIQRAGWEGGGCPPSADSTSGGGGGVPRKTACKKNVLDKRGDCNPQTPPPPVGFGASMVE